MLFPTLSFAAFFALVLPASWLLMPHRVRWRVFMVAASWFFYGAADWRFVPLLAASTVANQLFALLIHRASGPARKAWTVLAVTVDLVALGWFKYAGFLSLTLQSSLNDLGLRAHVPLPEVVLPVGISFFTFQALSYVIDTSRRKIEPAPFLDFAVYLSFFPHLIAGPIVRAAEFLPQIKKKIDPRRVDVSRACWLISAGLFKKVVIASYLGTYAADPLFGFPHQHAGVEALFGVYAYAVQIYMDFSGYTDIAIGLALLLGINFPQNFNAPYAAASLQDFWRRWHMTLSRWLRDYLYIPLGGNRQGKTRSYINVMITMLLGGLWHGAAWTFVAWGLLHGIGLCVERARREHKDGKGAAPPSTRPTEPDQPAETAVADQALVHALHVDPSPWRQDPLPSSRWLSAVPGTTSPAAEPAAMADRTPTWTATATVAPAVSWSVDDEDAPPPPIEAPALPTVEAPAPPAAEAPPPPAASVSNAAAADLPPPASVPNGATGGPAASVPNGATGAPSGPAVRDALPTEALASDRVAGVALSPEEPPGSASTHSGPVVVESPQVAPGGPAVAGAGKGGSVATGSSRPPGASRWPVTRSNWLGWVITFHAVCLAWIFFRATSFHNALEVMGRIADITGRHQPFNWKVAAVVVGSIAIQLGPRGIGSKLQAAFSRLPLWGQGLVLAGVLTTIDLLGPAGVAPFIYFRF